MGIDVTALCYNRSSQTQTGLQTVFNNSQTWLSKHFAVPHHLNSWGWWLCAQRTLLCVALLPKYSRLFAEISFSSSLSWDFNRKHSHPGPSSSTGNRSHGIMYFRELGMVYSLSASPNTQACDTSESNSWLLTFTATPTYWSGKKPSGDSKESWVNTQCLQGIPHSRLLNTSGCSFAMSSLIWSDKFIGKNPRNQLKAKGLQQVHSELGF